MPPGNCNLPSSDSSVQQIHTGRLASMCNDAPERRMLPLLTIDLSGGRQSVNVLGVQEAHHTVTFLHRGSIKGETVATVIDNYASHIRKTTVFVLDNASPHTCKLVLENRARWEERGLILYPLPAYSPELNEIEHLWKDVKYSRLPTSAWSGMQSLVQALTNTFKSLGRVVLMPSLACW